MVQLRSIILSLFCLICIQVLSQDCVGIFRGIVNAGKNQPAENAAIELFPVNATGNRSGSVTAPDGAFRFSGLCPGIYRVVVSHLGFKRLTDTVEIDGLVTRNFHLITETTELEAVIIHDDKADPQPSLNTSTMNIQELTAVSGKSLAEMTREIPGVTTLQAGPGIFKPVIHGVHSQRILILNHGVRQEGQQWGAEHAPEVDPFVANSITVIKDASAIRYGVDALGGVIVVNPPALPESEGLGGYAQLIGQSNGRGLTGSGSLQGGISGAPGWGWRIQGTMKNNGDYRTPGYNLSNTGVREVDYSGAIGFHNERGGLELFASRFATDIGILLGTAIGNLEDLARATSASEPANTHPFTRTIGEPRQAVEHVLTKLKVHRVFKAGEWRLQYAWQQNHRQEFDLRRSGLSRLPAIDLRLNTHTLDQEWQFATTEDRKLLIGFNTMLQNNINVPGTQRIPFIPNFTTNTAGIYGAASRTAGNLTADVGLRFDIRGYQVAGYDFKNTLYRRDLLFRNVSGTAGMVYRSGNGHTLNSTISTAWRPPHVAELFSLGTHQSAAAIEYGLFLDPQTNEIRNPDDVQFRNEQAVKWVGSWKKKNRLAEFDITTYANRIANYFWLRPGGITKNIRGAYPYFRYTQTDALFLGADAEIQLRASERLTVIPRGSWIRATDLRNKDFLIGIPANRLETALRYDRTRENGIHLTAEARCIRVFRQNRAPREITAQQFLEAELAGTNPLGNSVRNFDFLAPPQGYFLFQASASVSFHKWKQRHEVRLSAENVFNNNYRDYTNRFRYYADEIGRNFRISIKSYF